MAGKFLKVTNGKSKEVVENPFGKTRENSQLYERHSSQSEARKKKRKELFVSYWLTRFFFLPDSLVLLMNLVLFVVFVRLRMSRRHLFLVFLQLLFDPIYFYDETFAKIALFSFVYVLNLNGKFPKWRGGAVGLHTSMTSQKIWKIRYISEGLNRRKFMIILSKLHKI